MIVNLKETLRLFGMIGCVFALSPSGLDAAEQTPGNYWCYIGTYTGPKSKGIYVAEFDPTTGSLSTPKLAVETKSPSFLAVHPSKKFLYAVGEAGLAKGKKGGGVSAFAIDAKTGMLTFLNSQASGGNGPCHISLDKTGKCALVANYSSGSVASLPIQEDGKLKEAATIINHKGVAADLKRQQGPHGHSINPDPTNRFALAADLGLDRVYVYRLDAEKGTLEPHEPPYASLKPVDGPRHLAFHPSGKWVYVINEIRCTVTAFAYDPVLGTLTEFQSLSTIPGEIGENFSTAEIVAHPNGKFVYGSNRGHDSIAGYSVDQETGRLTSLGQTPALCKMPRNFVIDPSGKFLLTEGHLSNDVHIFRIDTESGKLTATGTKIEVGSPVCIRFVPMVE